MLAAPPVLLQASSVREAVVSLAASMQRGGARGVALYVLIYVVGALFTAPKALLSGLAGFAWGRTYGYAAALPTATFAASTAFLMGSVLARTNLGESLRAHPRFRIIDAVARADGLRITTLLRMSPIFPQNLLSYALGATPLPLWRFALGTFVGMAPMTFVQVYAGSLVRDAHLLFSASPEGTLGPRAWVFPVVGFAVTMGMMLLVMRIAKKAITAAFLKHAGEAQPQSGG